MGIAMSLDLASYVFSKLNPPEEREVEDLSASVVISAYNESEYIADAVRAQYRQTKRPKNVFVVNDNSTDNTDEICRSLQQEFPDLIYINNSQNKGKARNISDVVRNYYSELGDVVYVSDGDTIPEEGCLEELLRGFDSEDVAATNGNPVMVGGGSLASRMMTNGKKWMIEALKWRKTGQTARNGMYVLCGAVMAIRKDVLKEHPIPQRTRTEDLDYTWLLLEEGYKLRFQDRALCQSHDVIGLKDHWKQARRWHSGSWQALYSHGRNLKKSKGLLYTTLAPLLLGTAVSIGKMAAIPFLSSSYDPLMVGTFLATDVATSLVAGFSKPSYVKYIPSSFFYSGMWLASYITSGVQTTFQRLMHQEDKWKNTWTKNVTGPTPVAAIGSPTVNALNLADKVVYDRGLTRMEAKNVEA